MATAKKKPVTKKKAPAKKEAALPTNVVRPYPNLDAMQPRNLLVHLAAHPKQGKSTYAMSVLSHCPAEDIIAFEVEPGGLFAPLRQQHCRAWLLRQGVTAAALAAMPAQILACLTLEEFEQSLDYYVFAPAKANPEGNIPPYRVVVIDSLSELSDLIVERVSPSTYIGDRGRKAPLQGWGLIKEWWDSLLLRLRRLDDTIVITTSHLVDKEASPLYQKSDQPGTEMETLIVPSIAGSTCYSIMRKAGAFFELERKGTGKGATYTLWTDQRNRLFAGSRLDVNLTEKDIALGALLARNGYLD